MTQLPPQRPYSAGPATSRRRGVGFFGLLAVVFFVMPLVEVAALIGAGRVIGLWPTIGLLILMSLLGAWLMKREGSHAWHALREALSAGKMPARELTDAALVLVGGALLLTPGFVTDAAGLFLVLPVTRPITRGWLQSIAERQLLARTGIVRGVRLR
ncbi:FxsA family protein [Gephyromycinifex aptenodytis]|uniref:FxsA family protein n=1 Tax=Gephyromycinifex aptenodytis TaxID=2716227 RepID=UPI001D0270D3|nr:FxsA family protein [Gephyromycinifex aptenodytis]